MGVKASEAVQKRKVRTSVRFFRRKTARAPKAPKKSVLSSFAGMDKYRVIKAPVTSESAMKKVEEINTLVFVVDLKATKTQIKDAVQQLYEVKCARVNTLVRPDGTKRV